MGKRFDFLVLEKELRGIPVYILKPECHGRHTQIRCYIISDSAHPGLRHSTSMVGNQNVHLAIWRNVGRPCHLRRRAPLDTCHHCFYWLYHLVYSQLMIDKIVFLRVFAYI